MTCGVLYHVQPGTVTLPQCSSLPLVTVHFSKISFPCWDHLNKLTQWVTEFQGEQVSVSGCSSGPVAISGCKQSWGRWDITLHCSPELGEPVQCPCCCSHTTAASVLFYGCGECLFASGTWHALFLF